MPNGFVSLALTLGGGERQPGPVAPLAVASAAVASVATVVATAHAAAVASAPEPLPRAPRLAHVDDVVRELTLLRLAAVEAYARARVRLLEGLARDVLGRELVLAPCELEALSRAALARFSEHEPLGIRVAPGAAARIALDVPVTEDVTLAPGDLVIDVADGVIDARFTLRLAATLAALEDA